ncbi:MAG: hypothetical protein KA149_12245 [Chitinophagales bacterium]|nr:hypothetical protein [Chitinophagales bacterium]
MSKLNILESSKFFKGYNCPFLFIFISLAFFGFSNLVFAIAADVGVTLVVILISLRLMGFENANVIAHTHVHAPVLTGNEKKECCEHH